MKLNFKKTLLIILSASLLTLAAAESSFSGFAGVNLDVKPAANYIPEVFTQGVVAGHYALNESISFKGNFQFATGNIVSSGLFQSTPSTFAIRELSATYTFYGKRSAMHFSALIGDQNSFGSDSFVRQYLGVRKYSPSLMTPLITPFTAGMHTETGAGLSFADDFGPNALGVWCFYDKDDGTGKHQINADVQYAFLAGSSIFDTSLGITLPIENGTSGGQSSIQKVLLRGGTSTILNISGRMQLFFEAGVSGVSLPDYTPIGLENLFLFAEPRLFLPHCNLTLSFFCLSDSSLSNLPLITKPLGCNINFETLSFYLFKHTASAGIDIAACSPRDLDMTGTNGLDVIIAPYMDYSLFSGNFKISTEFHPLAYADIAAFFKTSISYKAQF